MPVFPHWVPAPSTVGGLCSVWQFGGGAAEQVQGTQEEVALGPQWDLVSPRLSLAFWVTICMRWRLGLWRVTGGAAGLPERRTCGTGGEQPEGGETAGATAVRALQMAPRDP